MDKANNSLRPEEIVAENYKTVFIGGGYVSSLAIWLRAGNSIVGKILFCLIISSGNSFQTV